MEQCILDRDTAVVVQQCFHGVNYLEGLVVALELEAALRPAHKQPVRDVLHTAMEPGTGKQCEYECAHRALQAGICIGHPLHCE
jgi:hypothetical protein